MLKIAVFASGRGSNFISLFNFINSEKINAEIKLVVSSKKETGAIKFANENKINSVYLNQNDFISEAEYILELKKYLELNEINFIVLAGYIKLIPIEIINKFRNKIINIHPALLPKFGGKGMFGENVHKAVIEAKEIFSGATVHFVDEEFDNGTIILQEKVSVNESDTAESLAKKVLEIEHKILPLAIKYFSENKILIENNITTILI